MSRSIVAGLIADQYPSECLMVLDRHLDKLDAFSQCYQVATTTDPDLLIAKSDVIILSIKPQAIPDFAAYYGQAIANRKPLLISVAAGIDLQTLGQFFGMQTAIVRAMPNTPSFIQTGATGLFANAVTSSQQKDAAEKILRAVGVVVWLERESLIAPLAVISGCGPAYFFLIMEILDKLGQDLGLDAKTAHLLSVQTGFGACKMALESGESLRELRQNVTSKGGVTEAILARLESEGLYDIFEKALSAGIKRSDELAKQLSFPKQLNQSQKD